MTRNIQRIGCLQHTRHSRWHRHSRFTRAHSQTARLSHQHDLHCHSRHRGKSCSALSGNRCSSAQGCMPIDVAGAGSRGPRAGDFGDRTNADVVVHFWLKPPRGSLPLTPSRPCTTSLIRVIRTTLFQLMLVKAKISRIIMALLGHLGAGFEVQGDFISSDCTDTGTDRR